MISERNYSSLCTMTCSKPTLFGIIYRIFQIYYIVEFNIMLSYRLNIKYNILSNIHYIVY